MSGVLPLLSLTDLGEIQARCLRPKLIRNPTLHELLALIENINQNPDHPITPSTLTQPINVSQFPIIVTGTILNPETGGTDHAGWLIQIFGSLNNTPFKGPHIVKLLANLNPNYASSLPIQIPIMVSSLSSFRKYACNIIDHLSFDRAAFLYIPQTKDIFRLWTMRCLIDLPQIPSISTCLHHFIPCAPTYAMFNTCALNPPSKKRARSGYSSSQKYTLERSLLTCLNSYYRQHANLGEALNTMISDSMETFNALLRLQKCADQSERLERLQQIWRTTQEQFYPPTIQTIPLDELYFTSADLI